MDGETVKLGKFILLCLLNLIVNSCFIEMTFVIKSIQRMKKM